MEHYGYVQESDKWYFNGKEINVGTPLPAPENLSPNSPDENAIIDVYINLSADKSDLGKVTVIGETNLPDGTQFMLEMRNTDGRAFLIEKVIVNNGAFKTTEAIDVTRPANRMENGTYKVWLLMPIQSSSVSEIIGGNRENITGDLVSFNSTYKENTIDVILDVEVK